MNVIGRIERVDVAEREWWEALLSALLRAGFGAGCWWVWIWGFKIQEVPGWSFYFAACIFSAMPLPQIYLRRRRDV